MATQNSNNLIVTNNADGYDVSGGTTARKLTLTGADITLTGSGANVYTFPGSTATLLATDGALSALTGTITSAVLGNSSLFIGTTEVALNRGTAALTLAGLTLTTPDIGTPSAGVLTNATGLPVTGLANGTDGELITWSAAGVAETVAVGTATHVLTSNGVGVAPTFQEAAGGASQLSELSDVVSATNTDKFALMANGTTGYVGRALVEADISDLGTYVTAAEAITAVEGEATLVFSGSISIGGHAFNDIDITAEFTDTDDHIMSSKAIKAKIENYGYSTEAGTVTAVTGTGAISSTGGATPEISVATADTDTTGVVTDTDWDTFNNKASTTAPTFATSITGSYLTASEILITDGDKKIVSAPVATYPSLTELSYVKGLSSAIQTQLGNKAATDQTFYIGTTAVDIDRASAALTLAGLTLTTPDIGTPSAGTLTNCTFPTLNQSTTGSAATLTTTRAIYGNNFDGSAALTQVIASTYGGTGNGFTKFTGPATAERTFTLPNANATLLYSGGALGTPSGGTATNITGLPAAAVVAGSLVAGMIAADHGTAATDQLVNVCYGTSATPPTASDTTEGTLYIQYTN